MSASRTRALALRLHAAYLQLDVGGLGAEGWTLALADRDARRAVFAARQPVVGQLAHRLSDAVLCRIGQDTAPGHRATEPGVGFLASRDPRPEEELSYVLFVARWCIDAVRHETQEQQDP